MVKSKPLLVRQQKNRPPGVVDKADRIAYWVEQRLNGMSLEELEIDLIMNGYTGTIHTEYKQAIERVVAFKQQRESVEEEESAEEPVEE